MSPKVSVGFLGNCQAQSLEAWVSKTATDVEVVQFDPVWLVREIDFAEYQERFRRCDIIFAQRVAEDYPIEWLRTSALKANFGERVLTWPNVYFDGYFPGLRYLYLGPAGKQLGPLDEYHYDFLIDAHRRQLSVEESVRYLTTDRVFEFSAEPIHQSLAHLIAREADLDVVMSDFIIQNLGARRSMFSMNHPCNHILKELMLRLMARANLMDRLGSIDEFQYTLDKIVIPFHPAIAARYHLIDDLCRTAFKGVRVDFSDGEITVGGTREYAASDLVECYFRCYDCIGLNKDAVAVGG